MRTSGNKRAEKRVSFRGQCIAPEGAADLEAATPIKLIPLHASRPHRSAAALMVRDSLIHHGAHRALWCGATINGRTKISFDTRTHTYTQEPSVARLVRAWDLIGASR